eukprot:GHVU01210655.1.p2 GENE.GHVU01210655.1~~GHVU01210655.1.p2  ORF type:complete len:109 (+),score=6.37 GHVU01210655.1:88-414(+)
MYLLQASVALVLLEAIDARSSSSLPVHRHPLNFLQPSWSVVPTRDPMARRQLPLVERLDDRQGGLRRRHRHSPTRAPTTVCYGVPGLFRWVANRYPSCISEFPLSKGE